MISNRKMRKARIGFNQTGRIAHSLSKLVLMGGCGVCVCVGGIYEVLIPLLIILIT